MKLPVLEKVSMENLAWEWLKHHQNPADEKTPTDCLIHFNTSLGGYTAEFYSFELDFTFGKYFITIPMMEKLISGTNPKNVKNSYLKTEVVPLNNNEVNNTTISIK